MTRINIINILIYKIISLSKKTIHKYINKNSTTNNKSTLSTNAVTQYHVKNSNATICSTHLNIPKQFPNHETSPQNKTI